MSCCRHGRFLAWIEAEIKQGTRRDAVLYSVGANATHGLRRTNQDKHRAVETLLRDEEWGKWSDYEIARKTGTSQPFVWNMRRLTNNIISDDNRAYITKHGTVATMNTVNIGHQPPPTAPEPYTLPAHPTWTRSTIEEQPAPRPVVLPEVEARFTRWSEDNLALGFDAFSSPVPRQEEEEEAELEDDDFEEEEEDDEPIVRRGVPAALQMSESNEWYTPAQYIEAARELMGGIDLDPASCALANETVQATRYYDIATNGLAQDWHGRVWLNPPYGRDGGESNQEIWSHRLIEHYHAGVTSEAILLVNANTEARWFQPLYEYLICFTNHRIRFYTSEGTPNQPTQGNALVYFGTQKARFLELFSRFGTVIEKAKV